MTTDEAAFVQAAAMIASQLIRDKASNSHEDGLSPEDRTWIAKTAVGLAREIVVQAGTVAKAAK